MLVLMSAPDLSDNDVSPRVTLSQSSLYVAAPPALAVTPRYICSSFSLYFTLLSLQVRCQLCKCKWPIWLYSLSIVCLPRNPNSSLTSCDMEPCFSTYPRVTFTLPATLSRPRERHRYQHMVDPARWSPSFEQTTKNGYGGWGSTLERQRNSWHCLLPCRRLRMLRRRRSHLHLWASTVCTRYQPLLSSSTLEQRRWSVRRPLLFFRYHDVTASAYNDNCSYYFYDHQCYWSGNAIFCDLCSSMLHSLSSTVIWTEARKLGKP